VKKMISKRTFTFLSGLAILLVFMVFTPLLGGIAAGQDARFCQVIVGVSIFIGLVSMYLIQYYEKRTREE
jgi:hypothetical protein